MQSDVIQERERYLECYCGYATDVNMHSRRPKVGRCTAVGAG